MTGRRLPLWTALGAVLVVALIAGSGVLSSSPPTAAQRAAAIESALRCPSCEDLSVAESSASTAVTVRATISQMIAEGRSDQQIETYLVDRYGSSIVLDPPASGWSLLVWLVPLIGGLIALVAVGWVMFRRRNVTSVDSPGSDTGSTLTTEETLQRRAFLLQSLADADAEYLAGDLSDEDYLALRHRDMVRLASLDSATSVATSVATTETNETNGGRSIAAPGDQVASATSVGSEVRRPSTRVRRNRWFLAGAAIAFGAAIIVSVLTFASGRQPGQSVTGSFAETPQQRVAETLVQAATDENQGQLDQAAQLYQSVLASHPDDEVAMAQLGWLEYRTGRSDADASLVAEGRAKLDRAVQLGPDDYAVRLYLGTVLLQQTGDSKGAVAQYRDFLADDPPAAIVSQAAPELREAFEAAGEPVPSELSS